MREEGHVAQVNYMGDGGVATGDVDKDQKFILALIYRDSQAKQ
jgi:hypothetical protein